MSTRTYRDAIEHLNSLQSNAATLEAVRASGGRMSEFAIPEMVEYLGRIGYTVRAPVSTVFPVFEFVSSLTTWTHSMLYISLARKARDRPVLSPILSSAKPCRSGKSVRKSREVMGLYPNAGLRSGLYTSPHLVAVRERIRVNGTPISEENFTRFFFDVWDRLDKNPVVYTLVSDVSLSAMTTHDRGNMLVHQQSPCTSASSHWWHSMRFWLSRCGYTMSGF
jgi:Folylpolyglutamate synthase